MKKVFIVLVVALMAQSMIAKADTTIVVPAAVTAAFNARFPSAQVKRWVQRPEGYVAVFKEQGKKHLASYAADGTWNGTETKIGWTWNLPDAVRAGFKKSGYASWKVNHINKIDGPDQVLYRLDIDQSPMLDADHSYLGEDWVLYFNGNGELVKKCQID